MDTCPLTGLQTTFYQEGSDMVFNYETSATGKVRLTDIAIREAVQLSEEEKYILAGISRNRSIKNGDIFVFNTAFLKKLYAQDIPYAFEERARHLLQYLYDNGGREYTEHHMDSVRDSPITYSSPNEFDRIIKYLKSENWIEFNHINRTQTGNFYQGLMITKAGIEEIKKGLPKMPMFGLVNQKIATGNADTDLIIETARQLFFDDHSTLEDKRSACEKLSYVIEPLRKELEGLFDGDTDAFFNIVNNFNVRNNKERTKRIQHEEQLEWVFYSMLNTINTYAKIKRKLG